MVAAALALTAEISHAQARTSGAVEATAGGALGQGGEFFDRDLTVARLAVSVRRLSTERFGMFGELGIDLLGVSSGHHAVCYTSPRGGCKDSYPEFLGPVALIGVIARRGNRIEGRLGIGGAAYRDFGPRVGAIVSQADVAYFPVRHVGVVGGGRWIVVPRYRGDRLSLIPWSVGVRIR